MCVCACGIHDLLCDRCLWFRLAAGLDVEDPDLQKELDELEGQVLEEKLW